MPSEISTIPELDHDAKSFVCRVIDTGSLSAEGEVRRLGMGVGARLRQLREEKNLSQGDITEATGLARSYISRVEHEHTVPSIETLHRFAAALGVPLYSIFYKGDEDLGKPASGPDRALEHLAAGAGSAAEDARFLLKMRDISAKLDDSERALLLQFARKLANRTRSRQRQVAAARHPAAGARHLG